MGALLGAGARLAMQIGVAELLRIILGELCYDPDPSAFKRKLATIEEAANAAMRARQPFPEANAATNAYVTEAACGYVSRLIASIMHPVDRM